MEFERKRDRTQIVGSSLLAALMLPGIPLLAFFPAHSEPWKVGSVLLVIALGLCVGLYLDCDAKMARARREYDRRY